MRILILFIFFAHTLVAQIGTGQWRLHVPASKAVDVVAGNGLIFAAYENGLVEYDPEAKEQSLPFHLSVCMLETTLILPLPIPRNGH